MTADAGDFAYPDDTSFWNQIDARLGPGSPVRQHLDVYIGHLSALAGIFAFDPDDVVW